MATYIVIPFFHINSNCMQKHENTQVVMSFSCKRRCALPTAVTFVPALLHLLHGYLK